LQIWERRRRIPSQLYNDPLVRLFEEFDLNSDSRLTAEEIAEALQSKRVDMSPQQVKLFIDVADADGNGTIEKSEFPGLLWHMATADLDKMSHSGAN
jgi:Ca2+-binding EF-hand superfamily protein